MGSVVIEAREVMVRLDGERCHHEEGAGAVRHFGLLLSRFENS